MPAKKKVVAKKKYTKRSPYWERLKTEKGNVPSEKKERKEISPRHLGITQVQTVKDVVVGEDITLKECGDSLLRWMVRTRPSLKTLKASFIAMIATKGMNIGESAGDLIYLKHMMNELTEENTPKILKAKAYIGIDDDQS